MSRPSTTEYFMKMAYLVATRATCDRAHVGCVLVNSQKRVVATGYNGSPTGAPHCDEAGHDLVDGHCVRTLHAESNAIDYAGRDARGCTLYCTHLPCIDCAKRIVNCGIRAVIFAEAYQSRYDRSDKVSAFLEGCNVAVEEYTPEEEYT